MDDDGGEYVRRGETRAIISNCAPCFATQRLLAGDATAARVWEADTGRLQLTLRSPSGGVRAAEFGPSGRWLITLSGRGHCHVFDGSPPADGKRHEEREPLGEPELPEELDLDVHTPASRPTRAGSCTTARATSTAAR